jgi:hypothetical protein
MIMVSNKMDRRWGVLLHVLEQLRLTPEPLCEKPAAHVHEAAPPALLLLAGHAEHTVALLLLKKPGKHAACQCACQDGVPQYLRAQQQTYECTARRTGCKSQHCREYTRAKRPSHSTPNQGHKHTWMQRCHWCSHSGRHCMPSSWQCCRYRQCKLFWGRQREPPHHVIGNTRRSE